MKCVAKSGPRILVSSAHVSFSSSKFEISQISAIQYDISTTKLLTKEVCRSNIDIDILFAVDSKFERLPLPVLKNFGNAGPLCTINTSNNVTIRKDLWILDISVQNQCEDTIIFESVELHISSSDLKVINSTIDISAINPEWKKNNTESYSYMIETLMDTFDPFPTHELGSLHIKWRR
jgi:hypothetical protein